MFPSGILIKQSRTFPFGPHITESCTYYLFLLFLFQFEQFKSTFQVTIFSVIYILLLNSSNNLFYFTHFTFDFDFSTKLLNENVFLYLIENNWNNLTFLPDNLTFRSSLCWSLWLLCSIWMSNYSNVKCSKYCKCCVCEMKLWILLLCWRVFMFSWQVTTLSEPGFKIQIFIELSTVSFFILHGKAHGVPFVSFIVIL